MRFHCLVCKGTGEVPNPDFEHCAKDETDYQPICKACVYYSACNKGEMIFCSNCEGMGSMQVDLTRWEKGD